MTTTGITGYGAYVPRLRIDRKHIADAHAWMAPSLKSAAKGSRAFCSWDEDAITMAVEAARDCLGSIDRGTLGRLLLASTSLPYADLQSSAIVAGALQLSDQIESADITNSTRAGTTALLQALKSDAPTLVVASDRPVAKPASAQELTFGAAAAAFEVGDGPVIADFLGGASLTVNFVDHFRAAEEKQGYYWEERWIRDEGLMKITPRVINNALTDAGLSITDVDYLIVPPIQRGIGKNIARKIGFEGQLVNELEDQCGYAAAAHPLLMLASLLEQVEAARTLLVVGFGQGADAIVLRTTDALAQRRPLRGVSGCIADGLATDSYLRMASFYDCIELEWGMRSEKNGKTILSSQFRHIDQTAGFTAGRCPHCGTVQFPQLQYCVNTDCRQSAVDFDQVPLPDEACSVFTFTSDWLSYYPAPPLNIGFVQFDNGARVMMEMVDVAPGELAVKKPLRTVFRVKEIDRARGYRRYFWKATPIATKEV